MSSVYVCSAVIEHTDKVIYLEDNDVAAVSGDGCKQPPLECLYLCSVYIHDIQYTVYHVYLLAYMCV